MASITRRNTGYQVQVRLHGFPPESRMFGSLAEARVWAHATETDLRRGNHQDVRGLKDYLLQDLLTRYGQEVSCKKKGERQELQRLRQLAKHPISRHSLASLRPSHLTQYREERLKAVSSDTVRLELALLSSLFETAQKEWQIRVENPCRLIRKPKPNPSREVRISDEEIERALSSYESPRLRLAVTLAVETAMRRSEITGLTWNRVDMVSRTAFLATTKNGQPRRVPLSNKAMVALSGTSRSGDLVVGLSPYRLTQVWHRACAKAALSVRFHDLRHEATSRLFEKGLNVMEVASITGHKTLGMLQRYTHLRPENLLDKIG